MRDERPLSKMAESEDPQFRMIFHRGKVRFVDIGRTRAP